MYIGIIGAGKAARTMARHMLANGHQVVISNSRGPDPSPTSSLNSATAQKRGRGTMS